MIVLLAKTSLDSRFCTRCDLKNSVHVGDEDGPGGACILAISQFIGRSLPHTLSLGALARLLERDIVYRDSAADIAATRVWKAPRVILRLHCRKAGSLFGYPSFIMA